MEKNRDDVTPEQLAFYRGSLLTVTASIGAFGIREKRNTDGIRETILLLKPVIAGQMYNHMWVDHTKLLKEKELKIGQTIEFLAIGTTYMRSVGNHVLSVKKMRKIRIIG